MANVTKKSVFKGITIEHVRSPRTLYNPARPAVFKCVAVERYVEFVPRAKDFALFFGSI